MYAGTWQVKKVAVSWVDFVLGALQDIAFSNNFLHALVQGLTDSTDATGANDQSETWETANKQFRLIANSI